MLIFQRITALRAVKYARPGLVALMLGIAACSAGPPVQEMSDARQAIAVAREAGAADHAADDLRAAENFLTSARNHLAKRLYDEARSDAVAAKDRALAALASTEASATHDPRR